MRRLAAAWLGAGLTATAGAAPPDLTLSGDARARLELRDSRLPDAEDERFLLRVRAAATITAAPGLTLGAGMTTSDEDDPRVSDVVVGNGGVRKPVRIDQAWLAWRPEGAPGLALTAGRMAMPLLCVQDLVYDGDWRPDGVAVSWSPPATGVWRGHLRTGAFRMTESGPDDLQLYAAQAAAEWKRGVDWRFLGGAGYHAVDEAAGQPPPLDSTSAAGNTLRPAGPEIPGPAAVLAEDFRTVEAFAQLTWDPWFPVTVYGQAVHNIAASDNAGGWLAGLTLGRARAVGALEIGWNVRALEADAVLASLADSDFAGGGTDVEGHKAYVRVHAVKDVFAGVAWFDGIRDPDGARLRETLWQFDLTVRF